MKINIRKGERVVKCDPGTWSLNKTYMVLDEDGFLVSIFEDTEEIDTNE